MLREVRAAIGVIPAVVAVMALALVAGCGKDDAGKGGKAKSGAAAKPGKAPAKSAKSKGYSEGAVSGGGSISGKISYTGATVDEKVQITKDAAVCGSGEIDSGALSVNGGALANALVELEGITSGKAWQGGTPTVDNIKCVFEPRFAVGRLGKEMIAKNSDPVLHNTHLYRVKDGKTKNLKNIALPNKDQTIPYKMKKPGLMDVRCDAHEWMQGWVFVSPHPYVAITDAGGTFKMTDVPAGKYKARIWHEKLGEAKAEVTVAAGGEAKVEHTFQ